MVNQSGIAGLSNIGDNSSIYAQVGIMDGIKIGKNVTIFASCAIATEDPILHFSPISVWDNTPLSITVLAPI